MGSSECVCALWQIEFTSRPEAVRCYGFFSPIARSRPFVPLEEREDLPCRKQGLSSRFPFTVPTLEKDMRYGYA